MRQVIRGILLGVSVFASINLFFLLTQRIAYYLDQINLMGILLTVGLLISGFVTGRFIGKKGFRYGVITGIFNYLFLCLVILLFAFYEYLGSGAPIRELILALGRFSLYLLVAVLPTLLVASLISGIGGWLGERSSVPL